MKMIYNLIGSNSNLAKNLYFFLKDKNLKINKFSHSDNEMEVNFKNSCSSNNINIYFSIVRDDLNASLDHLNKYLDLSNKFNSKFIYISSVNAKYPKASYYSNIKHECEKIVLKKGGNVIRLGLVISDNAFGPYLSLKKLANLPINLKFSNSTKIITTNIESFNKINFENIDNEIKEVFDNQYYLNNFLASNKKRKNQFNLNINLVVSFLKLLNKVFLLKGIFGRILTLTYDEN